MSRFAIFFFLLRDHDDNTACWFVRPQLTTAPQGRVHNPSGEGVRAISSQVQAKVAKHSSSQLSSDDHETKTKEGTAKRNITRKKTADKDTGNYNSIHKKQGGHGKGQWKDMMDPSYAEEMPLDEKDPLYVPSEDSNKFILSSIDQEAEKRGYDPGTTKAIYGPMLTKSEFKHQFAECLKEYFDSCDSDELIRSLDELGCKEYHAEIVKKAISLAMDKSSRERELTSRLLTCLHPSPLSTEDMEAGFCLLLDSLDDLTTDVPDAKVSVDGSFDEMHVPDDCTDDCRVLFGPRRCGRSLAARFHVGAKQ